MNAPFGGRPRQRRPTINITALIDVMFLLVIFFSVSSTFEERMAVDIALPTATTASEREELPNEIFIRRGGEIHLDVNQPPIDLETLKQRIAALVLEDPGASITLHADAGVDYQTVLGVIDAARSVGATQLILPAEVPADGLPTPG